MPAYVIVAALSVAALAGFVALSWALHDRADGSKRMRVIEGERDDGSGLAQAA